MQKILIMGLPGAGKTCLASALKQFIETATAPSVAIPDCAARTVNWLNADAVRKKYNDWDFSHDGRIRQSLRMAEFALNSTEDFVIADFVAPLVEMRNNFKADWTIWVDTISAGRYEDTNKAFIAPTVYDFRVNEQDAEKWAKYIGEFIINNARRPVFDWKKETTQMLGRWQPWHAGHRALFDRLITRTGQVIIQVRDCQGWNGTNPFEVEQVKNFIKRDLDPLYQGMYEIQVVPNIVHIGWGRGVGYTSGEELFDESITNISATAIRAQMNC